MLRCYYAFIRGVIITILNNVNPSTVELSTDAQIVLEKLKITTEYTELATRCFLPMLMNSQYNAAIHRVDKALNELEKAGLIVFSKKG